MKFKVLMLFIVLVSFVLVSCDSPHYTADQVIVIAQNYSPGKCSMGGHYDWDSMKYVAGSACYPSWEVEYIGNSIWEIRKKCHQIETKFYFNEKTTKISKRKS